MNKRGQNAMFEVLIALAIIFTGGYMIFYAIAHYDMQCNIVGDQGWWCVIGLVVLGLTFIVAGVYGIYYIIRGGGAPVSYE